jgi:hypothetical protein
MIELGMHGIYKNYQKFKLNEVNYQSVRCLNIDNDTFVDVENFK